MSETAANPDNYCYRHPDRQSFILCQRCGRTVCAECRVMAPVGVHCPECMTEARESAPRVAPAALTAVRRLTRADAPIVTYSIIALCVLVFIAEVLTGVLGAGDLGVVFWGLAFLPPYAVAEPWRMITSIFVHMTVLHILFNLYSLFILGPELEKLLGRARYVTLFLLAGLGGSVAVLFLAPDTVVSGASGAIFGLFGAYFVIVRHLGGGSRQMLIVIAINVVIGFIVPNIAWEAHIGGLIVGAGVAYLFVRTRERRLRNRQIALVAAVAVVLVVLTFVGVSLIS